MITWRAVSWNYLAVGAYTHIIAENRNLNFVRIWVEIQCQGSPYCTPSFLGRWWFRTWAHDYYLLEPPSLPRNSLKLTASKVTSSLSFGKRVQFTYLSHVKELAPPSRKKGMNIVSLLVYFEALKNPLE